MIRLILKKILKSYQKRLEKALDTLTSTPPSSDDEDVYNQTSKCVHLVPHRPLVDMNGKNKIDKRNLIEIINNRKQMEKLNKTNLVEDNTQNNDIKRRKIIKINLTHTEKLDKELAKKHQKFKYKQESEKDLSYRIKKTPKKIKSIHKNSKHPHYEQAKCKNNIII